MSRARASLTMSCGRYLDRWSELHGYDARANTLVHGWLVGMYGLARPLVAGRVSPHLLSVLGVLAPVLAVWWAGLGGRWSLGAAMLVALGGVFDNLDGAVAVLRNRVSRLGAILDTTADRVADLLGLAALWLAGDRALPCALAGGLMLAHEYGRARMRSRGGRDVILTISERPTRVIVCAMFLLACGVFVEPRWAAYGAWVLVVLGVAGLSQLLRGVRGR